MNLSKKSAPQLFIIHKSWLLIRFLLITHSLALIAAVTNTLPWSYRLIAVAAVGLSLFFYLQHYHYRFQPYQIEYNKNSGWTVRSDDTAQTITLLPSTLITTWFIVLHFHASTNRFQSKVIANDALTAQDYRALVMTLKTTTSDFASNQ